MSARAIERGVGTEQIAQTEALALHAAAFNGMPDPVFHLTARAMAIVTGLAAVEPDPRAGDNDVLLDAALQAATGLAQLLRFRGACATAQSAAEREAATACLLNAEAELTPWDFRRSTGALEAREKERTSRIARLPWSRARRVALAGGPR